MQKFGEVKFSKDRVKIQFWGKPVIFSNELCLYITRFASETAEQREERLRKQRMRDRARRASQATEDREA